jgi:hypothetical protein
VTLSGRDCPILISCGAAGRLDRIETTWPPLSSVAIATALSSQSTHLPPSIVQIYRTFPSSATLLVVWTTVVTRSFGLESLTVLSIPETSHPSSAVFTCDNLDRRPARLWIGNLRQVWETLVSLRQHGQA